MKNPVYEKCIKIAASCYQLHERDINSCTRNLYHQFSKHAHGNTAELSVRDTAFTMMEVASIESVFCALKKLDCFYLLLKIVVRYVFGF